MARIAGIGMGNGSDRLGGHNDQLSDPTLSVQRGGHVEALGVVVGAAKRDVLCLKAGADEHLN